MPYNYHNILLDTKPGKYLTSKLKYAKILQAQKKYAMADSVYGLLVNEMPENAEVLYQKGKVNQARKQKGFHQYYLDALTLDPTHIKAAHDVSKYFIEVDNYKTAKTICKATLEKVPDTPRLINLLAQVAHREKEWIKTLDLVIKLESLKTDLPKFIYEIKGNAYIKLGNPKLAVKAYEMAFNKDNSDLHMCLKISELHLYLKQPKKASYYLFYYEKNKDTSLWEFNYLMGKFYMEEQKYMMAYWQFEKVYKENINHEHSQYYRAVAADNFMKDKSKVLDLYTNYIETYEDEKKARYIELAVRRETDLRREIFMKE